MFDVLDLVVHADTPVTASQVASRAGIPVSTAFRVTGLLVERGLLQKQESGGLVPGSHLLQLGLRAMTRFGGTRELDAVARHIASQVPESVSAGLLVGDEIVLVARKEPAHSLRIVARVGDVIPPHTSAMGKAILAFLDDRRRNAVLAHAVGRDRAADVAAGLADELAEVRSTGFARDEEMYAVGQRCRAVPLISAHAGVYGGLSIAGPTPRFSQSQADEAIPALLAGARSISAPVELSPAEEATA
jgi:IclR family acetate operon transcriptional repressor